MRQRGGQGEARVSWVRAALCPCLSVVATSRLCGVAAESWRLSDGFGVSKRGLLVVAIYRRSAVESVGLGAEIRSSRLKCYFSDRLKHKNFT
jgi:hypothetical protein